MYRASLKEIGKILSLQVNQEISIEGIATDSRLVKSGQLFFALPGEKVDAHQFLDEAADKGACAAVVHQSYTSQSSFPLLHVPDVLEALQKIASSYLKSFQPKIVAVTGSLGKTTTKEFIAQILKQKYRVGNSPGNHNSQVGLPLSILNHLEGKEDYIVLEMGMTHAGQIEKLTQIAPPDIAVLTTIEAVHRVNFEGLDQIARAKGEIFSHPFTRVGILPLDVPFYSVLNDRGKCKKYTYSTLSKEANYKIERFREYFLVDAPDEERVMFDNPSLLGEHNYHNLLAAIVCAKLAGLDWYEIEKGISSIQLPERRLEKIEKNGIVFINDSYNAATASMKAALTTLKQVGQENRKVAVLGDMLELGEISREEHQKVAEKAMDCVDYLFCFGKEMYAAYEIWNKRNPDRVFWFSTRQELSASLKLFLNKGDHVLLKGSRGMETWKVLDELKVRP